MDKRTLLLGLVGSFGALVALRGVPNERSARFAGPLPVVEQPADPTPVLDEYRRINAAIAAGFVEGLGYVDAEATGLTFYEDATPEHKAEARAALLAMQDIITDAIVLSKRTPEVYQSNMTPEAWDPSPVRITGSPRLRILSADAGRCFDAGAFDDAASRMAAAIRFTSRSALLEDFIVSRIGTQSLITKLGAMLDQGAVFSPAAAADLEDALALAETEFRSVPARWERYARKTLADMREMAAAPDGSSQIHEYVSSSAWNDVSIAYLEKSVQGDPVAQMLLPALIRTPTAPVSAAAIAASLDQAETMIPRMRAAMEDRATGLAGLQQINAEMAADETQMARVVLGPFASMQGHTWQEMTRAACLRTRLAKMRDE